MKPKHSNQIVLRNKYYTSGLREIDIWNYYQKNIQKILDQVRERNIISFIKVDGNLVVIRNRSGKPIKLNVRNYDEIVTGRTLSIHGVMKKWENFGIVDIDTNNFKTAKTVTKDCFNILVSSKIFNDVTIRFTGKTSFHIICNFSKKLSIDKIRDILRGILSKLPYPIKKSKNNVDVNLDLYRNVYNAGYIIEGSLSVIGLKCMRIKYNDIDYFKYQDAII